MDIKLFQTSSLNKTFLYDKETPELLEQLSCLKGEEVSYQIVCQYRNSADRKCRLKVKIDSELSPYISVREVGNVPAELPAYVARKDGYDDDYISIQPGLFPDPLYELQDGIFEVIPSYNRSLWVSVKVPENLTAGTYPIRITLVDGTQDNSFTSIMKLDVINAVLPEQKLLFTQWFHADCLASYYHVEVLSEEHWRIIEAFVNNASDNGINMILTPIFTPPLDTEIGKERPTVQLVNISYDGTEYHFDFVNLKRWIEMCKRCGICYFEMAHLFTQWGAKCTPKIVVTENGQKVKKFGWHVAADSELYASFLKQFLPALTAFLEAERIADRTFFHISDEPREADTEYYLKAQHLVKQLLQGYKIIDAFSDYQLYRQGMVDRPVVAINKIKPYLENHVNHLWAYYCCSQCYRVSNRFLAMPSARNRIIGLQLYKFNIEGFLQWGYNFYYSQLSRELINPFLTTDAKNAFPAGDPFSVYPGDGKPIESIRLKVFKEALQDMRALQLLEAYMPKEDIVAVLEKEAGMTLEFDQYPKSSAYLLHIRETVNHLIQEYTAS